VAASASPVRCTPGGNCSKASQLVSTSPLARWVSTHSASWHRPPPVSLPTRTTSWRSSASSRPVTASATAMGERSASGFAGRRWAPGA
jgi:hypothetical protein